MLLKQVKDSLALIDEQIAKTEELINELDDPKAGKALGHLCISLSFIRELVEELFHQGQKEQ